LTRRDISLTFVRHSGHMPLFTYLAMPSNPDAVSMRRDNLKVLQAEAGFSAVNLSLNCVGACCVDR
jgi:hypothetical protein